MKEKFKDIKFRETSLATIAVCNEIIRDYKSQGLRLTLRQLYYQMVSKDLIPNTERSYKALGSVASDARLAGLMDWNAIEDRGRLPHVPGEYLDLEHLTQAAVRSYRLPRWHGQKFYCELWVEKDALSGVLAPLASQFHVTLCVNRGYSSQSALYRSAQRFLEADTDNQKMILFYLGDHDPSGEDMVRDIHDRLHLFGAELEVRKLALTMDQIRKYNPPPNPAKMSDSRAKKYVKKHKTKSSWEVDALPPSILASIITDAFNDVIDVEQMDKIKAEEERDKKRLLQAVKDLKAEDPNEEASGG